MAQIAVIGPDLHGAAMVERPLDRGHGPIVHGNRTRRGSDAAAERATTDRCNALDLFGNDGRPRLRTCTPAQAEGGMRRPDGGIAGLAAGAVLVGLHDSLPGRARRPQGAIANGVFSPPRGDATARVLVLADRAGAGVWMADDLAAATVTSASAGQTADQALRADRVHDRVPRKVAVHTARFGR